MARKAPTKLARLMKTGLLVLFIIAASVGATLYYSLQQSSTPAWLAWAEKGQSVEAAPAPALESVADLVEKSVANAAEEEAQRYPEPEPEPELEDSNHPKKTGWWQRRSFF